MGSSLALYNYLLSRGHQVHVITPSDYPSFLHWLPGNAEVIDYLLNESLALQKVKDAEMIFCLDFNHLSRIYKLGDSIRASTAFKVMIDHHLDPEGFEDFSYWDPKACASAELVYRFIKDLGDQSRIDKDIATCLYTGIMTDSGSFRFPSTTADVHHIVAELIAAGADNAHIHEMVYDNNQENKLRFLGYCLLNKLVILRELNTAYFTITKQELEAYNVQTGDTEGIVNYALSLNGIRLAVLIIDRGELRKLSFRSKGNFPANEIAKKYFEGGGHRNASGGMAKEDIAVVEQKLLGILPEYKLLLNQ